MNDKKSDFHVHDSAATASKLNWLRAAVLGANDGIVSVAGLVVGVAGATTNRPTLLTAGVAGLVAGALSMAAGEYVSVSSQADTQNALIEKEKGLLASNPVHELEELAHIYEGRGLSAATALTVAQELTEHDAITAHLEAEYGLNPNETASAPHAAVASAAAFVAGASIPLVAVVATPAPVRVPVTFAAVVLALIVTGLLSSKASETGWIRPTIRVIIGGVIAMIVTFGIGNLFSVHI